MSLTPFFVVCGLICLFWVLAHSILAARLDSFKDLVLLLLAVFFTAAGDVLIGSLTNSSVVAHFVVLLSAPAVIPLACLYLAHISRPIPSRPLHYIWIIFPIALFTAALIITVIKGLAQTDLLVDSIYMRSMRLRDCSLDGMDSIFYLWSFVGFRIVIFLECIVMIVYCIVMMVRHNFKPANWIGFFLRGRNIRVLEVQMMLSLFILAGFSIKSFFYLPFFTLHPAFTVCLVVVEAVLLFFFGLFALFASSEYITLADLPKALKFNYSWENRAVAKEEMVMQLVEELSPESLTKVISKMVIRSDSAVESTSSRVQESPSLASALLKNTKSWDEGSLVSRFQRLMTDDQLFLQPGLGLDDIVVRLKSNKTYISKMVNQTYGIGFPEVLNILRVDYAQQYMQKHKNASQDEIARASGFLSASSFNTIFKRITGFTPKVWASRK